MAEMRREVNLAPYIEHTLLKPDATLNQIRKHCDEAVANNFFGVCVPPYFVHEAKKQLTDSRVVIATVSGFPLGYQSLTTKCEDVLSSLVHGADEIDVVMNIAAFKSAEYNFVKNELETLRRNCINHILKVIIETALLNEKEIIKACEICAETKVDFVKTSTGFSTRGASVEDIKLMRKHLPSEIKIKASGGINTREFAIQLIEAGADRIGTSSGMKIIEINEKRI